MDGSTPLGRVATDADTVTAAHMFPIRTSEVGAPGQVAWPDAVAPRDPGRWLALVRVVVGVWFLKSLLSKIGWRLAGGVVPVPVATERWIGFLPQRLDEWAQSNPIGAYRRFLTEVAIPNAELFAYLTAFGEVAVGVGLTFGVLTGLASLGGIFLLLNYAVASAGQGLNQQGLHVVMLACLIAFLAARAGRVWGLDGWLRRRGPAALRRLPLT